MGDNDPFKGPSSVLVIFQRILDLILKLLIDIYLISFHTFP